MEQLYICMNLFGSNFTALQQIEPNSIRVPKTVGYLVPDRISVYPRNVRKRLLRWWKTLAVTENKSAELFADEAGGTQSWNSSVSLTSPKKHEVSTWHCFTDLLNLSNYVFLKDCYFVSRQNCLSHWFCDLPKQRCTVIWPGKSNLFPSSHTISW